jgi:hypothetical protein
VSIRPLVSSAAAAARVRAESVAVGRTIAPTTTRTREVLFAAAF